MARKFVVNDRVRVREDSLYAVASYQSKPLGFRRLVGIVKKVNGEDRVAVDFRQYDLPLRPDGKMYGQRTRISGLYRRRHSYTGNGYPSAILERA